MKPVKKLRQVSSSDFAGLVPHLMQNEFINWADRAEPWADVGTVSKVSDLVAMLKASSQLVAAASNLGGPSGAVVTDLLVASRRVSKSMLRDFEDSPVGETVARLDAMLAAARFLSESLSGAQHTEECELQHAFEGTLQMVEGLSEFLLEELLKASTPSVEH